MAKFKKCKGGHFFKEELGSCPYCNSVEESDVAIEASFTNDLWADTDEIIRESETIKNKKCVCGEVWCDSCINQHKQCECGKFFHKNFDLCPYCHKEEIDRQLKVNGLDSVSKNILDRAYHENGEIKSEGEYRHEFNCLSWGGPLDCRIIGIGCPECFMPSIYKVGLWKYYYRNGKLKYEGEYSDDERNGIWKVYDKNGTLTREIMYKNGEKYSPKSHVIR